MKFIRKLLPFLILGAAILVAFILIKAAPKPKTVVVEPNHPVIRTTIATPSEVTLMVGSQGSVAPRVLTQIAAEVGGRIVELSEEFVAGGIVKADDLIAKLDPLDYELAVAEASQRAAQADLLVAEEEARAVQAELDWKELGKGQAPDLTLRKPQLAQAKAAATAAGAAVASARRDLARTEIRAPHDGRVLEKRVAAGEFVARGAGLGAVYRTDRLEVELPLSQDELARIAPAFDSSGRLAEPIPVKLQARFGDNIAEWTGQVARTAAAYDEQTRTLRLVADIEPGGEVPLLSGQFVTASLQGRRLPEAIVLPRVAMVGKDRVLVLENGDTLRFKTVEIVGIDDQSVAVVKGLEPGEQVCITPLQSATDGMKVRVEKKEGTPET